MAGTIVTLAQQKGGTGKTTLAVHLAVAWVESGATVALVDCDPQGSLGEWFEARERALGEGATGLGFQTASGWGARREARRLARDHDIVVVDTPPKSDIEARPAVDAADLVVVPVQPSPVDVWSTAATLELARRELSPAVLVLNRVPARARIAGEMADAIAEFAPRIAATRIGNRVAFAACLREGLTVIETARSSRAADEVRALAGEIRRLVAA